MDFSQLRKYTLAAFPPMAMLLLVGCSSSVGFVDYADIPPPAASVGLAADGSDSGNAAPEELANSPAADSAADSETHGAVALQTADTRIAEPAANIVSTVSRTADDSETAATTAEASANEERQPDAPAIADRNIERPAAGGDSISDDPSDDTQSSTEPREIKLLVPEKRLRAEGDSKALRLSYDDIDLLKVLNMEPVPADAVDHFPKWLQDLDGKQVRLRGFMYPTFVATGITKFSLARDNGICCFVKTPKIYDMFDVLMADGESTDYIENKPFDVEGVFRIVPWFEDGEWYELYRIEDAIVLK